MRFLHTDAVISFKNRKGLAITVETYRGYELERRIEEQMAIAGYVLRYYEMVR